MFAKILAKGFFLVLLRGFQREGFAKGSQKDTMRNYFGNPSSHGAATNSGQPDLCGTLSLEEGTTLVGQCH